MVLVIDVVVVVVFVVGVGGETKEGGKVDILNFMRLFFPLNFPFEVSFDISHFS